jgi:hypothetical protein
MKTAESRGYVISASPGVWLYEYFSLARCPASCRGERGNFDGKKFGHPPVSIELKAKFAVWAFSVAEKARRISNDPQARDDALRKVDLMGRWLALELRAEIGSGPVIVYVDQFCDRGPRHWRITDTCRVQPYWHVPSAGYVIHCKDLAAWAWEYRPAGQHMIGGVVGEGEEWMNERPTSRKLVIAFSRWHKQWRKAADELFYDPGYSFDWDAHNAEGLALSRQLKESLEQGPERVIYLRPSEEPDERKSWKAAELLVDGTHRPYVHAPYWGEFCDSSRSKEQP